jgi:hypothetical protein
MDFSVMSARPRRINIAAKQNSPVKTDQFENQDQYAVVGNHEQVDFAQNPLVLLFPGQAPTGTVIHYEDSHRCQTQEYPICVHALDVRSQPPETLKEQNKHENGTCP